METRVVSGREATNRAGAAEYTGLSLSSVRIYSSPKNRVRFGWPDPLPERADRQDWFALEELDAYNERTSSNPGPSPSAAAGDPDELLTVAGFAKLAGVGLDTFKGFVERSVDAWDDDRDGYLPLPDHISPAAHGRRYEWRRRRALEWAQQERPGKPGRRPGPRPQAADVQAILDAARAAGRTPTNLEIAKALSLKYQDDIGVQVVQRLKRKLPQR